MSEKIDSTLKSVEQLESGFKLFSKELEKIKNQLEELKLVLNSQSVEQIIEPAPSPEVKPKKPPVIMRREDQEEVELLDNKGYQIQVVGLGVQKLD